MRYILAIFPKRSPILYTITNDIVYYTNVNDKFTSPTYFKSIYQFDEYLRTHKVRHFIYDSDLSIIDECDVALQRVSEQLI